MRKGGHGKVISHFKPMTVYRNRLKIDFVRKCEKGRGVENLP